MGRNIQFRITKGLVSTGGAPRLSGSYYVAGGTETDVDQILAIGTNQLVTVSYGPAGSSSGNLQAIEIYSSQNCTIITNGSRLGGRPDGHHHRARRRAARSSSDSRGDYGADRVGRLGGDRPVGPAGAGHDRQRQRHLHRREPPWYRRGLHVRRHAGHGASAGDRRRRGRTHRRQLARDGRHPHDARARPRTRSRHGEYPRALGHLRHWLAPVRRGCLVVVRDQLHHDAIAGPDPDLVIRARSASECIPPL